MQKVVIVLVGLALLVAACGTSRGPAAPSRSQAAPGSPEQPSAGPLVGTWQRVTSCERFLRALERAGLGEFSTELLVWSPSRWFPSEGSVPTGDRCRGATEAPYSVYFAEDGRFGVVDDDGVLVEKQTYRPVDEDTISLHLVTWDSVRGTVSVDYRIRGDVIRFGVVVPHPCGERCRQVTAWAIADLYAGPLQRID